MGSGGSAVENQSKWYHSKKFVSVIVAMLTFALNDRLGLNIDEETLGWIVGVVITYIVAQLGLDLKDRSGKKHSLQDPVVRDAIESLVSDFYDYALAKDKGISQHSLEVKEKVMEGLRIIMDPKFQKDAKDISQEILRLVMKFYKEDQNMSKGADLVKSQFLSLKKDQ
jgi:hypothetical protein